VSVVSVAGAIIYHRDTEFHRANRENSKEHHMSLATNYLGLVLKNPIVASSSPLSHTIDSIQRLEDAGASAVVMYSLFEEQITFESLYVDHYLRNNTNSYAESL